MNSMVMSTGRLEVRVGLLVEDDGVMKVAMLMKDPVMQKQLMDD